MSKLIEVATKLLGSAGGEMVESIFSGIDKLDNSTEKMEIQLKFQMLLTQLSEKMLEYESKIASARASVIKAEMKGNWLQRSWRPLLMVTFGALLVMRWMGVTTEIPESIELRLMDIIELGLGGYLIGRSAEKIVSSVDIGSVLATKRKKSMDD